jgi:serine/threonine protein kinase
VIKDLKVGDPASVGPYRLLGRLGAGGMGMVYLGKSPGGRLVAIKLIRPELAEERGFRSRFASEIAAARNVSGIYTAAVVDADSDAELPWMATVYVPGPSLTDAVEDNGPLPVESVLALAAGLAEALQAIHRADLVHRDLKPSNVLLAADGPRVIDFGISLALERSMMTATGMVMGSPGFMSPEQARGQREVGAPTDMFSFGAVLAFASTGTSPFGVGPTPALLYRVVNEVPDLTGVPGRLSPLIEQCLDKDPAARPTPAEVLAALSDDVEVLTGEWLPPAIAESMNRYNPTLHTPLPPALKEQEQSQATPAPASAGLVSGEVAAAVAAAAAASADHGSAARPGTVPSGPVHPGTARAEVAQPGSLAGPPPASGAPGAPVANRATPPPETALSGIPGPIGYEPTTLEPVVGASAAVGGASATRVERSLGPGMEATSLVPASGPFNRATPPLPGGTGGIPGGTGGMPPANRTSGWRRWRWPITAAAAAVIIAVVAVLLLSGSHGSPKVNPTASLAGDTTKPPATPTATTSASKTPARPTLTPTSQSGGNAPATQPSATATSNPTSSPTWTPTPTTSATATPTSSPTSSPTTSPTTAPTTSAPTTSPPTTNPATTAPTTAATP